MILEVHRELFFFCVCVCVFFYMGVIVKLHKNYGTIPKVLVTAGLNLAAVHEINGHN